MVRAPQLGDLILLKFEPQSGHEQAGRRPALVVSPSSCNSKVGLAWVCPITSKVKEYPFEVSLPDDAPVKGVVLADQLRSLNWRSRKAEVISNAPIVVVERVLQVVGALLS